MSKLVPKVPGLPPVPGVNRRQQFSASTRKALLDVAGALFAEQGYANTSLDAIVAGAEVTKGALYHHFSGKQALFEAVFTTVEAAGTKLIKDAMKGTKDPWAKSAAGLTAFLDVVRDPAYRRIVIQEGPAVLGYERYREHEERSSYAVVEDLVAGVVSSVGLTDDPEMVTTFAQIFFGGLQSAGESVATAADPEAAAARVEAVVGLILAAMQSLAGQDGLSLGD
ncbi:TetR/AcrR family transcriptional regulator [Nocardioides sp. Kera G14]|uniref:TetR/AcrR family transcriptional regulator n=1 Tax=Nocardioides sp. Kera G14 TaxID=2884264 RepID=UPI001D115283|nr:TetR/AcrR family transcriptional regulator [Nocardioides sp. Kera G14]UDY22795.1 TetR/AcrR family transcriptional regulator [Nocardioides sp. Kera G14]